MDYYCTLFDSFYLSKGLAMYQSLKASSGGFHLFIFAFDELSCCILKHLSLESVTVISLEDFETSELLEVKINRTKAEYCWTCTPSVIAHSIEKFNLPECTYIDADLFFYSDPGVLISEMKENQKGILITEHRFSLLPRWYELKRGGRFCVQFITVNNDPHSLKILQTWRNQCTEWCYARYEDGKFGDQKYLEEWPEKYENIHILQHQGGGLAPWNIGQFGFHQEGKGIIGFVRKKKYTFDPVFYHFQYVKMINEGVFDIGWHFIPEKIKEIFYLPYLNTIVEIENELVKLNKGYKIIYAKINIKGFKNTLKAAFKKLTNYNLIKIL